MSFLLSALAPRRAIIMRRLFMRHGTSHAASRPIPATRAASSLSIRDDDFDGLFPEEVRRLSGQHWTPIDVAERAALILSAAGATRVLDIGSGPGKFCLVGALATQMVFHGVEQRLWLVSVARESALRLGIHRAHFVHGNVTEISFEPYDGFYLFNPFHEQISRFVRQVDRSIHRSRATYDQYVLAVTRKLAATRPGTTVVTYNGFGGVMPPSFAQVGTELAGTDRLEIWARR